MEASACAEETPGVAGAIPYLAARDRNMKKIALIIFFALQAAFAHAAAFDQSAWDALLKKHVSALRNGQATQVDYAGFAADRGQLQQYLAAVSAVASSQFHHLELPSRY